MLFAGGGSPLPAGLIIWAISGWLCFAIRILVISRVKAAGSSTSAFASASGLSRTMAMSISPPQLLHVKCHLFFCGRRPLPFGGSHLRLPSGPAGIRTTTGSLSALARPTPYQLSHRVASRKMSPSLISHEGEDFCPMAGSESAQSCRSVYPVFGSIYLLFHTAL